MDGATDVVPEEDELEEDDEELLLELDDEELLEDELELDDELEELLASVVTLRAAEESESLESAS